MVDRLCTDIIAYHGWGYDSSCWQPWEAALTQPQCRFQRFDRGYFGTPKTPKFADAPTKIIFAHSYGLHLCPPEQLRQATALVLFNSFMTFHPEEHRLKQRSMKRLDRMVQQFQAQPEWVLSNFRTQCDHPLSDQPIALLNHPLLLADLEQLGNSMLDPRLLAHIPQLLILQGKRDRIVLPAQRERLEQVLPHSQIGLIDAGHALPFTHLQDCWAALQPILSSVVAKLRIAAEFGRSPATYQGHADLQKYCAARLLCLLDQASLPQGDILEIGCGTGFITQGLIDRLGDRSLHITDLSAAMLRFCQEHLDLSRLQGSIEFQQGDGELLPTKPYAVIVAGFVVQWFQHPTRSLQRLVQQLVPGGILLVSFPSSHSFAKWRGLCDRLNLPFTANLLPDRQLLQRLPAENIHCWTQTETVGATFTTAAEFFKGLKAIGAGCNTAGKSLSVTQMKRLIQTWDDDCKGTIVVYYDVVYGVIQRF